MENKIELSQENEANIQLVREKLVEYKIDYTEDSIDFVLSKLHKSFEDTIEFSDEHLKIIYMCGLPNHDRKDALKIMSDLRKTGIPYRLQHLIMVKILKEDHFFMDGDSGTNLRNLWLTMML